MTEPQKSMKRKSTELQGERQDSTVFAGDDFCFYFRVSKCARYLSNTLYVLAF